MRLGENFLQAKISSYTVLVSQARPHQILAAGPFFLIKWVWLM